MPRYFFDVRRGERLSVDLFGDEMDDEAAAASQAMALLPELFAKQGPPSRTLEVAVVVRDEAGAVVAEAVASLRCDLFGKDRPRPGSSRP